MEHEDKSLARRSGATRRSTGRGTTPSKSSSTKPTAARASGRNAAQQNDTSDEQKTISTTARKRQPRSLQTSSSSHPGQPMLQRQAKSAQTGDSASRQRSDRGSKLTALLDSPIVRNVMAASLVSAAAALIYRKPKAIAAASEGVQEAASELLESGVGVARTATKALRKPKRRAVTAAEPVATSSASATQDASAAELEAGSSPKASADESMAGTTSVHQRTRKRRSDAGMKRGPRTSGSLRAAPINSPPKPSALPASLDEMETSAFAFDATQAHRTKETGMETELAASEEQLTEGHPS